MPSKHPISSICQNGCSYLFINISLGALVLLFIGAQAGLSALPMKNRAAYILHSIVSAHGNSYHSTISLLMDELLPISTFTKYIPVFSLKERCPDWFRVADCILIFLKYLSEIHMLYHFQTIPHEPCFLQDSDIFWNKIISFLFYTRRYRYFYWCCIGNDRFIGSQNI